MKNVFLILILLVQGTSLFAQVGIGTATPHVSAMLEVVSDNKGFLLPKLTSVQRLAISSPVSGLQVYDTNTNSIWFFNGNHWINTVAMSTYGDIKSGVQNTDHNGWIKLDGRLISSLSTTQQSVITGLGFSGSLPNASDAYLVQNAATLGTVAGSNTTTLVQANLPNVNFTGSTSDAGAHSHTGTTAQNGSHTHTGTAQAAGSHTHSGSADANGNHTHNLNMVSKDNGDFSNVSGQHPTGDANKFNGNDHDISTETAGNHTHSLSINSNGEHTHTLSINSAGQHDHTFSTSTSTNHSHTVSVASGGSGTAINIAPKSLTVNMFIYLGL